ncbi:MAG: DUF3592 domain-containing protein [Planctomycetes bacterium]|nr:DUF3592 domain-containing protein [Planctomycetota bacterium]
MTTPRNRRIGSIVILLLVALAVGGWYGPRLLVEARATAAWPRAAGEVVARDVQPPPKPGESWRLALRYRYELDGVVYRSDRWDVHGPALFATRAAAEQAAAELPPGSTVEVRYDPQDPARAVLHAGGTGRAWGFIALGGLVVLVAARLLATLPPRTS